MCVAAVAGAANALAAVGTVVSMAATNQQAKASAAAYNSQAEANDANARIAQQQAQDSVARGQVQEDQQRQKAARFKAQQKAAFAATGVDSTSGSSLEVLTDTAFGSEMDAANIRYNAGQEALGFRQQANNYTYQARSDRAAASNAKTAGKWQMASTLIGGATTIADRWNKKKYGIGWDNNPNSNKP
ncbi:hypothetical protein SOV_17400 [Sporomusa ovata DSM 2662]|nr:hypothetical protein [Sporomusa ovata]EQB29340.1 hypothetical protein SOV_1c10730 [Sporomusa ovata DSM 2662]